MGFALQGISAQEVSSVPVYQEAKLLSILPADIAANPTYEKIPMRYPQLSEIQKRTSQIRRDLLMARIKQCGFQGVALMSLTLAAYKLAQGSYQWWQTPKKPESDITIIAVPSWQEVGPDVMARLKRVTPQAFSFDWLKYVGGYGIDGFMMLLVGQVVGIKMNDYLSKDLFNPEHGSVTWFASNKTSLLTVMEELKQYVLVLDGPATKSEQNKAMYDYFIISAINSVVVHLESIIGFVDYKQTLVADDLAAQMGHISRYLFNITNQFCHDVDELLANKEIEPRLRKAKMESMVNELRGEVARIVVSFSRIEAEHGI